MKIQDLYENAFSDDEIVTKIKNDCAPYLSEGVALYRGMSSDSDFARNRVRKDRQPLHSSIIIHDIFDHFLYKHNGIKGRSQCVFATTVKRHTAMYGDARVIFPIGDYKCVSSSKIKDITVDTDSYVSNIIADYWRKFNGEDKYAKSRSDLYNEITFPNDNKKSKHVIMRNFDDHENYEEFMKYFTERMEQYFIHYEYKNIIQKGVEIMIDCNEYYSMTVEAYERIKDRL